MNPDSHNFEQLRKLLALKRHEQPPPGYFNRFSGQVISRIKAGEKAGDGLDWLGRLWSVLETKPMLTGAFGAAVCALVISGIVFSGDVETGASNAPATAGFSPVLGNSSTEPLAMPGANAFAPGTNPVSPALRALLDGTPLNPQTAPVGFGFPGGN